MFLRPADATNDDHADMNMFVVNTDGTGLTRLNPPGTATGLIDDPIVSAQSWSPSGKQVAFVAAQGSFATDPRAVYVVDQEITVQPGMIFHRPERLEFEWDTDA